MCMNVVELVGGLLLCTCLIDEQAENGMHTKVEFGPVVRLMADCLDYFD